MVVVANALVCMVCKCMYTVHGFKTQSHLSPSQTVYNMLKVVTK